MSKDKKTGAATPGTMIPMPMPAETMFRRTKYFEIDSVKAGARYAVWVTVPFNYDKDEKKSFPAIYAPDGNGMVLVCAGVSAGGAAELIDPLEPAIQICVGYAGEDLLKTLAVRARDLLPPKEYLEPGMTDGIRKSGGMGLLDQAGADLYAYNLENPAGDRFLAFLTEELHPFIAKNYRIKADDLALWGHSYGGLFATYAALQKKTIFKRFGLSSPGIAPQHSVVFQMLKDAAADGLSPRELHMTVATRELTDPTLYQGLVGAGTIEFMRQVGSTPIKGVTFTSQIFDDETHISVTTPAYYGFLRTYYRRRG